jgi:hypothetical protein
MLSAMQATTITAIRPETFRLPKPGASDPFFGFSRSYYYELEKRGDVRLIHLRAKGKGRGVTLVPFQQVERFVQSQLEA